MEHKTVKQQFFSGILWQAITIFFNVFSGLLLFYFITRKLSPIIIGEYTILMSIVLFLSEISELGVGASIVQTNHISEGKKRTATLINLIIALSVIPIFWWGGKLASNFFSLNVQPYTGYLFAIFIARLFMSIPQGLLIRNFEFKKLSQIQIVILIVNLLVSLVLIFLNFELKALLISQVICSLLNFILVSYTARYIPRFAFHKSDFWEIYHFGKSLTMIRLIRILSLRIDKIIIGKISGLYNLGIYERIQYVFEIVLKQINTMIDSVLFSTLSKNQDQDEFTKILFIRFFELSIFWLVISEFIIINNATLLLNLMLGEKWNGFENIFIVFSFIFFFSFVPVVIDTLVRSRNKMSKNIVVKLIYLFSIIGFTTIGAHYSITWASVGILLASFIHFVGMLNFVFKELNVKATEIVKSLRFVFVIVTITQILLFVIQYFLKLNGMFLLSLSFVILALGLALVIYTNILESRQIYYTNKNLLTNFIQAIKSKNATKK